MREALDRWTREVGPGAAGWLGTTAGVTEDGTFISLVRFESQDAGRRNKDRPEVDTWWSETAELFTGEPVLTASSNVVVDVAGEPDAAGFVQVIQGRNSDADRARELMADDSPEWARWRPDILGSSVAEHDGGAYTMALYFTSEEAARERESTEPPPELKAVMEEMNALTVGTPEFFDLRQPWLHSPG